MGVRERSTWIPGAASLRPRIYHTGSAWTDQDDAFDVVPVPSTEHVLCRGETPRQPESQRGGFNWATCQLKYHFHLKGKLV